MEGRSKAPPESGSDSLVSDVVKVALVHVNPLDAQQEVPAAGQAGALWQSRVVDDGSPSRARQLLPALRRRCSPLGPRNDVPWGSRGNTSSEPHSPPGELGA